MAKIIQLTAKFSEGDLAYLIKGDGMFQEVKVVRTSNIIFDEACNQSIYYKLHDVYGEELDGNYIQANLRSVDDMIEVFMKKSPYHWEQRGMK